MAERKGIYFVDEPINTVGIGKTPDYVNVLSESPRYEDGFSEMIHRHSNYTHCRRVGEIAQNLLFYAATQLPFIQREEFLAEQSVLVDFFAAHHDDDEIYRTDFPSDAKFRWTEEEKKENQRLEAIAIRKVGKEYLKLNDEEQARHEKYMQLYREKEIFAAQIVDMADKLDALGEVFHELRCGNKDFIRAYQYYRDEKLPAFDQQYGLWGYIKDDPYIQIGSLPSDEEVLKMPQLSKEDLKSRETIMQDIDAPSLPIWYRTWLKMSMNLLGPKPQPEFHLFPGWKTELRRKWNQQEQVDIV